MGFQEAALCAWSMAGPAAIRYAAARPARLARLVLVEVAGLGSGLPPLRLRDLRHVVLARLLGRPTRGLVRILWRNWVRREDIDTRPLELATYRFLRENPAALQAPPDERAAEALGDALSSIEVPTLVLAGRHSGVLGPHHGRAAAALLPRGKLLVFEESSHALQLEESERFQDAVAAFVLDRT
jgi:pimeloyl-ACP methyl ester carboxylesterase